MKTVKPIRLSVLNRPYSDGERDMLAVTGMVLMPFADPTQLITEPAFWKFVSEQLGKDAMLDAGMPKPNAEFLVAGKCFAPGGKPVELMPVRVKVGAREKTLAVSGDRQWVFVKKDWQISPAQPFTELDLSYANAFGGPDFERNPLGKGMPPADEAAPRPLPNIFNPKSPILKPEDRPEPVGFAAIDFTWPQRFSKAGTYDEQWRQTRFPGFAADMDWTIFNAAQPDQWLAGFLHGDERIEVSGMHPDQATQSAALPGFAARCFITEKTGQTEEFREVPMHAETVWLFPNASHMVLIFRGVTPIASDDASSVLHLIAGLESLGEPKPAAHYRTVLEQRLDKRKGAAWSLDDNPLLPAGLKDAAPVPAVAEVDELTQSRGFMEDNQRRKVEKELARGREEAIAQREQLLELARRQGLPPPDLSGLDKVIAQTLPPRMPKPRADQLPQILDEAEKEAMQARAAALAQKAEMDIRLRELCAQQGLDFDKLPKALPPPRLKADATLANLQDAAAAARAQGAPSAQLEAMLADPAFAARLQAAEQGSLQSYRMGAQHYAPSGLLPEAQALREQVIAGLSRGESLAGRDLTGADLSGLDLSGADFSAALLESASFAGATLSSARLAGALLAHADLSGAVLTGATLSDANLGKARLAGVQAQGANFSRAVLDEADLGDADFSDAQLDGAKIASAKLAGAKFVRVSAPGVHLIDMFNVKPDTPVEEQPGLDLRSTDFSGANLKGALLLNSRLEGARLPGVNLEDATLLGVEAAGADFSGAALAGVRVVHGSRLGGAVFANADLSRANLRGIHLDAADFSGARLEGADVSGASLRLAKLGGAQAKEMRAVKTDFSSARLDRANLHGAVLQRAEVAGADLRGSNLYMADLLKLKRDDLTLLTDANLGRTTLKGDGRDK